MIFGWGRTMRRRVLAVILLAVFGAGDLRADQPGTDQRILFMPTPLGTGQRGFEREPSLEPRSSPVPAPKPRPGLAARPATRTPVLGTDWSKIRFDRTGSPPGTPLLAGPQPQALDFSRGVDLGGISLGLDTGHGNEGGGTKNLLSPEAKDPVPSD